MKFSIPTNWDDKLVEYLESSDIKGELEDVYGKLALDETGGGRTASSLIFVSKKKAALHIKKLQDKGIKFTYLLNTLCMDNLEFTRVGQNKLRALLDWLIGAGVGSVTVANPYIFMWVKKNYPHMSISVSTMCNINSLIRAKFWEDLGADRITFPAPAVNRNFSLIRLFRKNLKCRMQLIANGGCINNCPTFISHALMNSHASQSWHRCRGYMFDYYNIMCRLRRLENPVLFIKSDWIRPEDLPYYENLGIDSIKLIDRRLPTDAIIKIITAYHNREHKGNLLDILPLFKGSSFHADKSLRKKIFYLTLPFTMMNPVKILKFSKLFSDIDVIIDNAKLGNFIKNMPKDCNTGSCGNCRYCEDAARSAILADEDYLKLAAEKYRKILDEVFSRGLSFLF